MLLSLVFILTGVVEGRKVGDAVGDSKGEAVLVPLYQTGWDISLPINPVLDSTEMFVE